MMEGDEDEYIDDSELTSDHDIISLHTIDESEEVLYLTGESADEGELVEDFHGEDLDEVLPQMAPPEEDPHIVESHEEEPMVEESHQEEPLVEESHQENPFEEEPHEEEPSIETPSEIIDKYTRIEEPPAKMVKLDVDCDRNVGEHTCSICFEEWTSAGEHRLVSLKCGHLFGYSCIRRWLIPKNNRMCPTCKSKSFIKDLRFIYPTCISYVDNTEVQAVKSALESVSNELQKTTLKLHQYALKEKSHLARIKKLEAQIKELKRSEVTSKRPSKTATFWKFSLEKNLEILKEPTCRVFARSSSSVFISQTSGNSLFGGYGVREFDCETFALGRFVILHGKDIRGLAYSPPNNLMMSVSLDKTVKLFSDRMVESATVVSEAPLWSCCWDCERSNRFYVGTSGGAVLVYDTRQTNSRLTKIPPLPGDMSPVTAVASVPGGAVVCQLNSLRVCAKTDGDFENSRLPLGGPLLGLNYDPRSSTLAVSTRPAGTSGQCEHLMYSLNLYADACDVVHTFKGSQKQTLMTKTAQFAVGDEHAFAAHNESRGAIDVWSIGRQTALSSLPCDDPVVDLCPWSHDGRHFLGALTRNRIRVYKLLPDEP